MYYCVYCNAEIKSKFHREIHINSHKHKLNKFLHNIPENMIPKAIDFMENKTRYYTSFKRNEYKFEDVKNTIKYLVKAPYFFLFELNQDIIDVGQLLTYEDWPKFSKIIKITKVKKI